MAKRQGLGRGLDTLIPKGTKPVTEAKPAPAPATTPTRIPLASIQRAAWQPRKEFDEASLAELAESITTHGILQPLLVRGIEGGYELLAGERRLRAARLAGLKDVPVTIVTATDEQALEMALVENLQREDLNPIEEAEGYRSLTERFRLTQEDIAKRVGKGRASVANALRLLKLPETIRRMLSDGSLTTGHAKALLGLDIEAEQILLAQRVVKDQLSVRQTEQLVEHIKRGPRKPRAQRFDVPREHVAYLSEKLHQRFGSAVRVHPSRTFANGKKAKGSIEIDFYSSDDLDRILSIIGLELD